ncbi:MAG TPA: aldehyde dehydrogenase family protein, partial [Patescibacteria group bacterium]|nr:aldehyde dehydrogenase family protein [Patescibacteria group bacterium]
MFIGGGWTAGKGSELQEVVNPASGEVIAHVPKGTAEDVDAAVKAARKAYDEVWSESTPRDRSERMLRLADVIEANGDELARIESLNVGKPLAVTKSDEIPPIADCFRFFAGAARLLEGRATGEYMQGYTSMLRRESLGVVGSIAPWNYPLMMAAWKLGPALAAGNCVVLKPSEWTPLTVLRLAELIGDILPPGVLNIITGDGEPVGAGLVRHPGVAMVSLTG